MTGAPLFPKALQAVIDRYTVRYDPRHHALDLARLGAGATFGRWRAERIRAYRDMNNIWKNKDNYRDYKKWKIWRH